MSVATTLVTSLAYSAAVVAAPTAGIVLASTSDQVSETAKVGLLVMSGLVLTVTFLANVGKALPVIQGGMRLLMPPKTDSPDTLTLTHGRCVTRAEMESRLKEVMNAMQQDSSDNREEFEDVREDIKSLTQTMSKLVGDMNRAVGQLEGEVKRIKSA